MPHEVLRVEKLKTLRNVKASGMHLYREFFETHIDVELSEHNSYGPPRIHSDKSPEQDGKRTPCPAWGVKSSDQLVAAAEVVLGNLQRQKNAVVCLEYLISTGREEDGVLVRLGSEEKQDAFFVAASEWVIAKHGARNVVGMVTHRDEQVPHMHIMVVPESENRWGHKSLGAARYVNGPAMLSQMQTDFHTQVGEKFGLARGEVGSPSLHVTPKQWRAIVQEAHREVVNFNLDFEGVLAAMPTLGDRKILTKKDREAYEVRLRDYFGKHMNDGMTLLLQTRLKLKAIEAERLEVRKRKIKDLEDQLGQEKAKSASLERNLQYWMELAQEFLKKIWDLVTFAKLGDQSGLNRTIAEIETTKEFEPFSEEKSNSPPQRSLNAGRE